MTFLDTLRYIVKVCNTFRDIVIRELTYRFQFISLGQLVVVKASWLS